jgi:type II secretory pathway pseudopilin PulG
MMSRRGTNLIEVLASMAIASMVLTVCVTGLLTLQRQAAFQNEATVAWLELNNTAERIRTMSVEQMKSFLVEAEAAQSKQGDSKGYRITDAEGFGVSSSVVDQLVAPELYATFEKQEDPMLECYRVDLWLEWSASLNHTRRRLPLSLWRSWRS